MVNLHDGLPRTMARIRRLVRENPSDRELQRLLHTLLTSMSAEKINEDDVHSILAQMEQRTRAMTDKPRHSGGQTPLSPPFSLAVAQLTTPAPHHGGGEAPTRPPVLQHLGSPVVQTSPQRRRASPPSPSASVYARSPPPLPKLSGHVEQELANAVEEGRIALAAAAMAAADEKDVQLAEGRGSRPGSRRSSSETAASTSGWQAPSDVPGDALEARPAAEPLGGERGAAQWLAPEQRLETMRRRHEQALSELRQKGFRDARQAQAHHEYAISQVRAASPPPLPAATCPWAPPSVPPYPLPPRQRAMRAAPAGVGRRPAACTPRAALADASGPVCLQLRRQMEQQLSAAVEAKRIEARRAEDLAGQVTELHARLRRLELASSPGEADALPSEIQTQIAAELTAMSQSHRLELSAKERAAAAMLEKEIASRERSLAKLEARFAEERAELEKHAARLEVPPAAPALACPL